MPLISEGYLLAQIYISLDQVAVMYGQKSLENEFIT